MLVVVIKGTTDEKLCVCRYARNAHVGV